MNNRIITSFFLVAGAMSTSACSMTALRGDEVSLSGSPEGIRAFSEMIEGVQILAKTAPESLPQNPQSALRMGQIKVKLMSGVKGGN